MKVHRPSFTLHEQAAAWAEQLKKDPAFTSSDAEELKSHLIDLSEDLIHQGLSEDEAFLVASARLGLNAELKEDFIEVNRPFIQLRKAILMLSGILFFFLLYFIMICSTRLLLHSLRDIIDDPTLRMYLVFCVVISFHLLVVFVALFVYFSNGKLVRKIVELKIKPYQTTALFLEILFLSIAEGWLHILNNEVFVSDNYTHDRMLVIVDYTNYTYPLVLIVCFLMLYRKFYSNTVAVRHDVTTPVNLHQKEEPTLQGESAATNPELAWDDVSVPDAIVSGKIRLNEEEVMRVSQPRMINTSAQMEPSVRFQDGSMSSLMNVLAGVLLYFFLYYLMLSTARMLFCALQYLDRHVSTNVLRTWSYVICFQSMFVVITAGLIFREKNMLEWLNRRQLKPLHSRRLLYSTIFLAIVDRCFFPIARKLIRAEGPGLEFDYYNIFTVSEYSFPFILGSCFLVLFYKYYRDHVHTGS